MLLPEQFELVFRRAWSWQTLLLAALAVSVAVSYWNRPTRDIMGPWLSRFLTTVKVVAAILLVLYLVNPRLRYVTVRKGETGVAIALDSSMSMSASDALNQTRYAAARDVFFTGGDALGARLSKDFQMHYYLFSRGLTETDRVSVGRKPDPAGLETDFVASLQALASEVRSKRIRAVILASDGNNTAGGDLRRAAQDLGAPIYTIAVGRRLDAADPWRDLGIERVESPTRVDVGQELEVKVRLRQEGLGGRPAQIDVSWEGRTLETTPYQLTHAPTQTVPVRFTPETKGTHTFVFSVPRLEGDRVEENDEIRLTLAVGDRQIKVLYIEGTLRRVYKPLKNTLESEESMLADCVVRTGGAQFYHQGKSAIRFYKGLPAEYEGIEQYDVIVLGDFPRGFLDDTQMQLIDRWVREDKGGLLHIGGIHSFASGDYIGSPLEAMMPATFRKQSVPRSPAPTKLSLTTAGAAETAMSGLGKILPQTPFDRAFRVGSLKPGAQSWIKAVSGPASGNSVLCAQRYGQGRTMLLACDSIHQMALRESGEIEQSPSARFWLQTMRWLAQAEEPDDKDAPFLMASTDRAFYEAGQDVRIRAQLRKPPNPNRRLQVTGEALLDGEVIQELRFPKVDDQRKTELVWSPPHDGRFTVRLTGAIGREEESVDVETLIGRPFLEMEKNALNETTLRNLARDSGGGYFNLLNAEDVEQVLQTAVSSVSQTVSKDLLDSPIFFVLFCAVVSTEWILRRRRSLI
jgi:uncharacterized membrane protein